MANKTEIRECIFDGIIECHMNFETYGGRSDRDLDILMHMFQKRLEEFSDKDVSAAFDHHIKTGKSFPRISDILASLTPVIVYQLDHGPYGFGALYHADHPYVRGVARQEDITRYAVEVSPMEARGLQIEAQGSPAIKAGNDDAPQITDRRGGGFRSLDYDA